MGNLVVTGLLLLRRADGLWLVYDTNDKEKYALDYMGGRLCVPIPINTAVPGIMFLNVENKMSTSR